MARKHARPASNGELASGDNGEPAHKQPASVRFVNVSLNDVDQQWLAAHLSELDLHISELLQWVADEQLRVGVSYDPKSKRWNATATSWVVGDPRYGVILSVRGKSPAIALYCLAYATGFKLAEGWGAAMDDTGGLFG